MYIYVGIVDTAAAAAELVVWGYHTWYTRHNRHNQDHRTPHRVIVSWTMFTSEERALKKAKTTDSEPGMIKYRTGMSVQVAQFIFLTSCCCCTT